MIVCLTTPSGNEFFREDVAAVVCFHGHVRLCRDGQPDEYIDDNIKVCVVP